MKQAYIRNGFEIVLSLCYIAICILCFFFCISLVSGQQENAEEPIQWVRFRTAVASVPFEIQYPKNFVVDPGSEIRPPEVEYVHPANKPNEYGKWCFILDSPDGDLHIVVCYASCITPSLGEAYKTGLDFVRAYGFREMPVCIERCENYVKIHHVSDATTTKNGIDLKFWLCVYMSKDHADMQNILPYQQTIVTQSISFSERKPGAFDKYRDTIQRIIDNYVCGFSSKLKDEK